MARAIRTDPAQQAAVSGAGIPQGPSFMEALATLTELREQGQDDIRARIMTFLQGNPDMQASLLAQPGFLESLVETQAQIDKPRTGEKGSKVAGPPAPRGPSLVEQTQTGAAAFIKKRDTLAAAKRRSELLKTTAAIKNTMARFLVGNEKGPPENFNAVQRFFLSEEPTERAEAWRFLNENAPLSIRSFSVTPEVRTLMETARLGADVGQFRSMAEGVQKLIASDLSDVEMQKLKRETASMQIQVIGFTLENLSNKAKDRGFMVAKEKQVFRKKILDLQDTLKEAVGELAQLEANRKLQEERQGKGQTAFGVVVSPAQEAELRRFIASIRLAITEAEGQLAKFRSEPDAKGTPDKDRIYKEFLLSLPEEGK